VAGSAHDDAGDGWTSAAPVVRRGRRLRANRAARIWPACPSCLELCEAASSGECGSKYGPIRRRGQSSGRSRRSPTEWLRPLGNRTTPRGVCRQLRHSAAAARTRPETPAGDAAESHLVLRRSGRTMPAVTRSSPLLELTVADATPFGARERCTRRKRPTRSAEAALTHECG
jgi:hypothetical protein